MTKDNDNRDRITKWIRWIARIWSLPIIVYVLIMFFFYAWNWVTTGVADPKAVEDYSPIEALPPIFMFLGILGLAVAWRWELLGGTITIVFHLVAFSLPLIHGLITHDFHSLSVPYFLSLIITTPGILFIVCWWQSRKIAKNYDSA